MRTSTTRATRSLLRAALSAAPLVGVGLLLGAQTAVAAPEVADQRPSLNLLQDDAAGAQVVQQIGTVADSTVESVWAVPDDLPQYASGEAPIVSTTGLE